MVQNSLTVRSDPRLLAQMIHNLVSNAVKYGKGKPIEVVLRADPGYVPSPAGARTLDAFIQERFARTETFGHYSIWRRREQARP